MGSLLGIVLLVLVACVVLWAVQRLLAAFGIGEPIATVIWVVVVILILVLVIGQLGFIHGVRVF